MQKLTENYCIFDLLTIDLVLNSAFELSTIHTDACLPNRMEYSTQTFNFVTHQQVTKETRNYTTPNDESFITTNKAFQRCFMAWDKLC